MDNDSIRTVQIPRRFVASDWGGTETVVLETSRRLKASGHPTEIWTTMALSDRPKDEIGSVAVRRFGYFYPYLGLSDRNRRALDFKGGNLFSFSMLAALRRNREIDIIHMHTGNRLGGIGRSAAMKLGIPYVISLHGGLFDVPAGEAADLMSPVAGKLEWGKALGWMVGSRRVIEDASAVICLGETEERRLREAWPGKAVVRLENGVDPEAFSGGDGAGFRRHFGIPDSDRIVLCVGRIDPQKDQMTAISAFAEVNRRFPDARLVLIGHVTDPGYMARIEKEVAECGSAAAITVIPGVDRNSTHISDAYAAAECFVLPSRHEPFGIVILEAWAAGLPVVASSVGGIPSFVTDNMNGYLVEPGNPAAFADRISTLFEHPGMAREMGSKGRDLARGRYSWEAITGRLVQVYRQAIERHHRTGGRT